MARARRRREPPQASSPAAPPPPSPAALAVIRLALLLGVLAFGAATTYIVRRGDWRPVASDSLDSLRIIGIVLWVVAIAGVAFLRFRPMRIAGRGGIAAPGIIGWALGEAVAVFGGVHYFLTGTASWYLNGVLLLVATFVIFPIRRAGDGSRANPSG